MWMEKYGKWFHVMMLIVAMLFILLMLCLAGCSTSNKSVQVIWHDGECLLYVDGISADQAGNMSKEWEFGDCGVKVESELGEGQAGPEDHL